LFIQNTNLDEIAASGVLECNKMGYRPGRKLLWTLFFIGLDRLSGRRQRAATTLVRLSFDDLDG